MKYKIVKQQKINKAKSQVFFILKINNNLARLIDYEKKEREYTNYLYYKENKGLILMTLYQYI